MPRSWETCYVTKGHAMNIREMTEAECRAMLARRNVARLACARNNQPYIVPIHVDLEGDYLYGFAMPGQKIEWMRENPLVCLENEEFTNDRQWASVVVFGHYEELPNTARIRGPAWSSGAPLPESSDVVGTRRRSTRRA